MHESAWWKLYPARECLSNEKKKVKFFIKLMSSDSSGLFHHYVPSATQVVLMPVSMQRHAVCSDSGAIT